MALARVAQYNGVSWEKNQSKPLPTAARRRSEGASEDRVTESPSGTTRGLNPIPGDAPAGVAATYEPAFEELAAEIAKLDSLSGDDPVRWPRVVELGTRILLETSKDLQAAAYRAMGLFHTQGYAGLEDGLTVLRDMLKTYWDGLFPPLKRMRGRKQALEWLADRGVAFLESTPPADAGPLALCIERMQELDSLGRELFPDGPPGITKLLSKLREMQAQQAADAGPSQEGTTEPSAGGPVAVVGAKPPSGVIATREQAFDQLRKVIEFLRKHDPHSPVSYVLERAHRWGQLSYEDLYKDLMSRHGDARQALWWVLGIKE